MIVNNKKNEEEDKQRSELCFTDGVAVKQVEWIESGHVTIVATTNLAYSCVMWLADGHKEKSQMANDCVFIWFVLAQCLCSHNKQQYHFSQL